MVPGLVLEEKNVLLEAFKRAKKLNICPNRLWEVAGEDLPKTLPDCDLSPVIAETAQEHEECTAGFCEYSLRDFTAVQQRHECRNGDGDVSKKCVPIKGRFPSFLRDKAALEGKPTTWNLSGNAMLEQSRPYMAISHVWADGTGTGAWQAGTVNECLYSFFENIARHFACEGIWWDTLCIPREKAARTLAIQKMEKSYEDARITLVHDCFLRDWEWDPRTAYFGILMSPWFSRGWTALELKKSRKIKVIFKGRYGPVIKDLDEEILAKHDDPEGPRKAGSRIIQSLRKDAASFKLNDLLTILRSRYTSWPKDMAVISALLVGLSPEARQQETYRKILQKFGSIAPGHLFHYNVTMSKGFSWCPASLFDMPIDPSDPSLAVSANGDLNGIWRVLPADQCVDLEEKCWWNDMHPLIKCEIQGALRISWQCLLLAECNKVPVTRALLVRETATPDFYQYIGALCFRQELSEDPEDHLWVERSVTILGRDFENQQFLSDQCPGEDAVKSRTQPFNSNKDLSLEISESSMLHTAIWRGDYESFLDLIEVSDLSITDDMGRGPLHLAAERGHLKMVQDLVLNVDLNLQCLNGQTALHTAAWGGSTSVVTALLRAGVDRTIKDNDGNLPLHKAAQVGYLEVVKLLLEDDVDAKGHNDLTLLHFATIHGHEEMVKFLEGADLEARDNKFGWTPLHCAIDYGVFEIVELLIERGADVNAVDNLTWWTPLHISMINGDTEISRLLFENGAAAALDKHGWMPHHFAEVNGHTELLKLLRGNSNLGSVNEFSWTPLHCRAINNKPGISKLLVDRDAEIYVQPRTMDWSELGFAAERNFKETIEWLLLKGHLTTYDDSDLLYKAVENGYEALTRVLVNKGVNVEYPDYEGWKPLHIASRKGHESVVRLLIEAGAETNSVSRDSAEVALHLAAEHGHTSVVELLLQSGAGRDVQNKCQFTAIHFATLHGHEECVISLLRGGADPSIEGFVAEYDDGTIDKSVGAQRPLYTAIKKGHDAIAKILIGAMSTLNSEMGGWSLTALHTAIDMESFSITKFLLEAGADPNCSLRGQERPLHSAAISGNKEVIQLLLDAGADITATDNWKRTLLHAFARGARGPDGNVIPFLISAGAEIEARDEDELTPLQAACNEETSVGNEWRIQRFLEAGADVNAEDDFGQTPLHLAHSAAATQLLLSAGANIHAKNSLDENPLFPAIQYNPGSIELLLDAGADIEAKENIQGQTPLIYAAEWGGYVPTEAVARLLERGANIKAKDNEGYDALYYARQRVEEGEEEAVEMVDLLRDAGNHTTRYVRRLFRNFRTRKRSDPTHSQDSFEEEI